MSEWRRGEIIAVDASEVIGKEYDHTIRFHGDLPVWLRKIGVLVEVVEVGVTATLTAKVAELEGAVTLHKKMSSSRYGLWMKTVQERDSLICAVEEALVTWDAWVKYEGKLSPIMKLRTILAEVGEKP